MRHLRPRNCSLIAAADHQRVSCGDPQSFPSFSTITVSDSDPSTGFQQVSPMKTSRFQRIRSGLARFAILPVLLGTAATMLIGSTASAQLYTSSGSTGAWDSARWSTTNAAPYTTVWTSGSSAFFANTGTPYSFSKMVGATSGTVTLGSVTLADSGTVTVGNGTSGNRIIFQSSVITGSANSFINFGNTQVSAGSIAKNGSGGMFLVGGTYAGGFTLNDGLVVAGGTNAFGTGALTITGGAIGGNGNRILGVTSVSATGDFQVGSSSSLGGNSSTANITINSSVALGGTGARTITLGNDGTQTFSGVMSGGSGVKFAQASTALTGKFSLTGANTYSGGTEINATTVQVSGNNAALSTGNVTLTGANASQLRINSGLTLANNFVIASSAGTKLISNETADGSLTGGITNNDTTAGNFVLAGDAGRTFTVSGVISGAGGLQVGNSSLTGDVLLSGVNSYSGSTDIDSIARLVVGNNNAIRNTLNFNGAGTLDLAGFASTVNQVAGSAGTITSSVAGSSLTLGGDNSSSTLNANIADFGGDPSLGVALLKNGTGTLTLSGANLQYSGLTTVNTGTVNVNTLQEFLGGVLVNSNGSLTGSGVFTGDMNVTNGRIAVNAIVNSAPGSFTAANIAISGANSNTVLAIDSATNYSSLTTQGNLAYDGNLVIRFDNATTYADYVGFNLFNIANAPTGNFATVTTAAGSGPYSGLTFIYNPSLGNWYSNGSPSDPQFLQFSPSTGQLVIVPEPSTWAMTLASVGFAGWMARRKKLASKKQRQLAA